MEANLDPRTEGLAIGTLDQFYEDGGTLPIVFKSTGNPNSWGVAVPTYFNDDTPKVQGAAAVEASLPPRPPMALRPPARSTPPPMIGKAWARS